MKKKITDLTNSKLLLANHNMLIFVITTFVIISRSKVEKSLLFCVHVGLGPRIWKDEFGVLVLEWG